jgi:hypothetical protein
MVVAELLIELPGPSVSKRKPKLTVLLGGNPRTTPKRPPIRVVNG